MSVSVLLPMGTVHKIEKGCLMIVLSTTQPLHNIDTRPDTASQEF